MKFCHSIIWLFLLSMLFGGCQKEKNTSALAYDTIPTIVNQENKFLYQFNIGYLNIDTLISLHLAFDSMEIHLKIQDYKSGNAGCFLRGSEVNYLNLSPLIGNKDTLIFMVNSDTIRHWRFLTYKFTGHFTFEINPWNKSLE